MWQINRWWCAPPQPPCCLACDWWRERYPPALTFRRVGCSEQMRRRLSPRRDPRGLGAAGGRGSACPRAFGFASILTLRAAVRPVLARLAPDPKAKIAQRQGKEVPHHQAPCRMLSEGGLRRLLRLSPLFCGVRQKMAASFQTHGSCWSPWDFWRCPMPLTEWSLPCSSLVNTPVFRVYRVWGKVSFLIRLNRTLRPCPCCRDFQMSSSSDISPLENVPRCAARGGWPDPCRHGGTWRVDVEGQGAMKGGFSPAALQRGQGDGLQMGLRKPS